MTSPRRLAAGIAHVPANGVFSISDGIRTDEDGGRALRSRWRDLHAFAPDSLEPQTTHECRKDGSMVQKKFRGNFTRQPAIPEDAINAAVEVMRSGRLHRYNVAGDEETETAALEREFAAWQGVPYCLAVASGGQAIQIALRAAGVRSGDSVLTNAFTLAPVPGAVAAVGGRSVLVEITENLVIDFDDLARKAESSGAKFLLLSHMRGHLCDMEQLMAVANAHDLCVIEDCAHTMGARWNGIRSGNFGRAGCFSTQTYKHMNSGEGGLLTSADPEFMARATILSGSYMLYARHGAAPPESCFAEARLDMPNTSARMDNLRAAILRPQLEALETAILKWNARHDVVSRHLAGAALPKRSTKEFHVGSSIQFRIPGLDADGCHRFLGRLADRGIEVKWFGSEAPTGFTSTHRSWRYLERTELPRTDSILSTVFDMRLPLSFSLGDCDCIGAILAEEIEIAKRSVPVPDRL